MPVNKTKDVGRVFGEWTIIETLGKGKVLCRCSCGTERVVYKKSLVIGATKSCGCKRTENFRRSVTDDLTGVRFGAWEVIKELGSGYVDCRCDCGTVRRIHKPALKSGATTSCGCESRGKAASKNIENHSLIGKTFNELTVIEELGGGLIRCKCSCGNEYIGRKQSIKSGHTKSCGCKTYSSEYRVDNKVGEVYGEWEIIEELGNNKVRCRCSCGTERILRKDTVVQGRSRSCGCKSTEIFRQTMIDRYGELSVHKLGLPREVWQIEAVSSQESLRDFISDNYLCKPTIKMLAEVLGLGESSMGKKMLNYNLYSYVSKPIGTSFYEATLYNYIAELVDPNDIIVRDKTVLNGKELDIYIPSKRIAIEFNGVYWHSALFKSCKYHQDKTIECSRKGIRLIHIFEYEWVDSFKKNRIKMYLKDTICRDKNAKIYARNTIVNEVTASEAREFVNENHLQGYINSSINIGCFYNNELVGVMTLGKTRYDNSYEYEIYRMCFKTGVSILGGATKMFAHFINKYKPNSVVTYSDISKFTGNIYTVMGFTAVRITSPNYVWVNRSSFEVLSREKTQKHRLIKEKIGTPEQTEDEIMYSLGYYKVYDSGSIKLEIQIK